MTEAALVAHLSRLPRARGAFKQLVRELGAKGEERAAMEAALERLVARGELVELRAGHYAVTARSREFAAGRLQMHRDGYGFLISEQPVEGIAGDVFLPRGAIGRAMHGDRVVARIARLGPDGRAEGEVLRVLERAHPTVVGEFHVRRRGCFVAPHDARIGTWIEIPEGMEGPHAPADLDGMVVDVEMIEYGEHLVGRVIEVLGRPGDFGVDVEIVIRKHHLPHRFPAEAVEQAAAISPAVAPADLAGRHDFRDLAVVTIDGETARDFDDAVWVERLPNGHYALDVHIADVAHYVRPGTPIDAEARLRGTSVYFPDRAVPMLPAELSTGICSLNPGVDRLVLSARLEIDHQGETVARDFIPGVIRSVERMTYTNVHLLLEGDAGLRARYAPLVERFHLMRELALVLQRKRQRRGSIDFDLPEPLIEFDEWGAMTGVTRAPRNMAHRLIEEFMLAANEAVAAHLEAAGPSLYRIHEPPDPRRVMEFEEVAAHFGYSLVRDASVRITPRMYQKLVAKIEGKAEERILSHLMLRSLRQARYSADNTGHFALGAPVYTHFTSPIRRYPDLVVHRLLRAALERREPPPEAELRAVAGECSGTERRAAEAERELVEWKKVNFMAARVGDQFDALVVSTTRFGMFVELTDLFVEGLVAIDSLPGERFTYHENARKIVGERSRREFAIGDRLRVLLDRVDAAERKMLFSLAEPERPRRLRARKAS